MLANRRRRGACLLTAAAMLAAGIAVDVQAAGPATTGRPHSRELLARTRLAPPSGANRRLTIRNRLGSTPLSLPGVGANVQVSPVDGNVYSTTAAAADPTNHSNLFASANILT